MCEFCNNPFDKSNKDIKHIEFAGFFSTDAINAAVSQAIASRKQVNSNSNNNNKDDDDEESTNDNESDGTVQHVTSIEGSTTDSKQQQEHEQVQLMEHPYDKNLYLIPNDLSPIYKPLPLLLRTIILFVCTYITSLQSTLIRTTIQMIQSLHYHIGISIWLPLKVIQLLIHHIYWLKKHVIYDFIYMIIKSYIIYTITTTLLQDCILFKQYSPSRISIHDLITTYNTTQIPSKFSNYYNNINDNTCTNSTVHYLKLDRMNTPTKKNINYNNMIIYMNHGFGASSLSFLSILPLFNNIFNNIQNTITILGHDAPGFGFTDRLLIPKPSLIQKQSNNNNNTMITNNNTKQDGSYYYSINNSANIGTKILRQHMTTGAVGNNNNKNNNHEANILLIGHSVGCITTLHMALQLQKENNVRQHIVLIAPALGLQQPPRNNNKHQQQQRTTKKRSLSYIDRIPTTQNHQLIKINMFIQKFIQRPIQRMTTSILCYGLKRIVGQRNFWKRGLQFAWGNPNELVLEKNSNIILQYEWPSIVQHWEYGLLQFAMAQQYRQKQQQQQMMHNENLSFQSTNHDYNDAFYPTDHELIQAVLNTSNVESIHVIVGSKDRIISPNIVKKFFANYTNAIQITYLDGLGHNPHEENPYLFVETVQELLQQQL